MLIRTQIAIFNTLILAISLPVFAYFLGLNVDFVSASDHLPLYSVTIIVAFLLNYLLAYFALLPLYNLVKQINTLNPGDLGKRIPIRSNNDAVKWLIEEFNKLLNKLEEILNHQKMFITNVSHEVKNPLSSIINEIDVTLSLERSTSEYKTTLCSIRESVEDLSEVSTKLLQFARLKANAKEINFSPVRVDELIWSCKKALLQSHPNYRVKFKILDLPDNEEALCIQANQGLLSIGISNILVNACKYSQDHSAEISLSNTEDGRIWIEVCDKGPGIPEQDQAHLFDLFFRGEETSYIGGTGIGLPLAKSIFDIHNISLEIKSSDKGTCVLIDCPNLNPLLLKSAIDS